MTPYESLLTLLGLHFLGCCSPGPVFLLIATASAEHGRARGLRVALGVACATFIWACLAAFGLSAMLSSRPWADAALRLVAGLYLLKLGIGMVRNGVVKAPISVPAPRDRSAFVAGFVTSITNPKALAFFGSAFALTAPASPTPGYAAIAVIALTASSAFWHSVLGVLFAARGLRRGYRTFKARTDIVVGILLAGLGGVMLAQGLVDAL